MLEIPQLAIIDLDDTLYDYNFANKAGEKALNAYISWDCTTRSFAQ